MARGELKLYYGLREVAHNCPVYRSSRMSDSEELGDRILFISFQLSYMYTYMITSV